MCMVLNLVLVVTQVANCMLTFDPLLEITLLQSNFRVLCKLSFSYM